MQIISKNIIDIILRYRNLLQLILFTLKIAIIDIIWQILSFLNPSVYNKLYNNIII